jgi:ABC-type transport system involved in multi-copper enzyme maturation permease subunit
MNFALMRRQTLAVLRLELKKTFLSKRGWWIYLLALGPVFVTFMHSLVEARKIDPGCNLQEDYMIFAGIFQVFYLRLGIYFGCVAVFMNLFRGEILEKTLHYYFLAPLRREVVVAGKFLAGLITTIVVFTLSTAASYYSIGAHFGPAHSDYLWSHTGIHNLAWYLIVSALGCIGYGSVFTVAGLMFRNPMFPAAGVMIWEGLNLFLPPLLKKISIVFYLQSLLPVTIPVGDNPFALLAVPADPTPAWLAIPGLLLVAAAALVYAGLQARRTEISYVE